MGRTLGPFTGVSTARVDGAYEIYRGNDEAGREVEILTLGSSSSKDPARRALLSDTVAWAHATRGPADASILSADLETEQPYVVTLNQEGLRGVERMLERMLAMGPSAGPLTAVGQNSGQFPIVGAPTGHIPVVNQHTDPHGIPRVVSTPPAGSPVAPASPMASYVTQADSQGSRPPWLVPMAVSLILLVMVAGGFFVFYGMSGEDGDASPSKTESAPSNDASPEPELPEWNSQLPSVTVIGDSNYAEGQGAEIALENWPYAFKVTKDLTCEPEAKLSARCTGGNDGGLPEVELHVEQCPNKCDDEAKKALVNSFEMPGNPSKVDPDTQVSSQYGNGRYAAAMIRFFEPEADTDLFTTVTVRGEPSEDTVAELNRIINGVATQTPHSLAAGLRFVAAAATWRPGFYEACLIL